MFLCALEDQRAVFAGHRVVIQEALLRRAQVLGQMFDVTLSEFYFGHAATLSAGPAINRVVDLFRGFLELPLHVVVRLQPSAKLEVLRMLLFAEAFNLDQIGEQLARYGNITFVDPSLLRRGG